MDDIFKELLDKAPDVIDKAAQSPLGLASLIVLVLGIVAAFLFRNVVGTLKLAAFATITAGLLGVIAFVFVVPNPELPPGRKINGTWHDINDPSSLEYVTQRGNQFEFTKNGTLPSGIQYKSSGNGTLWGSTYTTTYRTEYKDGSTSTGSCRGALPREGFSMSTCKDTMFGEFPVSMVRE